MGQGDKREVISTSKNCVRLCVSLRPSGAVQCALLTGKVGVVKCGFFGWHAIFAPTFRHSSRRINCLKASIELFSVYCPSWRTFRKVSFARQRLDDRSYIHLAWRCTPLSIDDKRAVRHACRPDRLLRQVSGRYRFDLAGLHITPLRAARNIDDGASVPCQRGRSVVTYRKNYVQLIGVRWGELIDLCRTANIDCDGFTGIRREIHVRGEQAAGLTIP